MLFLVDIDLGFCVVNMIYGERKTLQLLISNLYLNIFFLTRLNNLTIGQSLTVVVHCHSKS